MKIVIGIVIISVLSTSFCVDKLDLTIKAATVTLGVALVAKYAPSLYSDVKLLVKGK